MSHETLQQDARDSTSYEKAAANIVAGIILGIGQIVHALFKTTFQILSSLV